MTARAVIAHVGGQRLQREGAHHQRFLHGPVILRVVTAQICGDRGRAGTVVVGAIGLRPGRMIKGRAVEEVDGARHRVLRFVGEALAVEDLGDGRVAPGLIGGAGLAVLDVGDGEVLAHGAGTFVGRNDLVQVPAIIMLGAVGFGPELQGVAVAAELVERATGVIHIEAGLAGIAAGDLVDAQVGDMKGLVEAGLGGRHQAVADVAHPTQKVPGLGAGAARRIFLRGDAAQGERPAIAHVPCRGDGAVALVGVAAGVGEQQVRHKAACIGRQRERVAESELARVALHPAQQRGRWALVLRVTAHGERAGTQHRALAGKRLGHRVVGERDGQATGGRFGGAGSGQQAWPAHIQGVGIQVQGVDLPALVVIEQRERRGEADAGDGPVGGINDLELVGTHQVHLLGKVAGYLADLQGERAAGREAWGHRGLGEVDRTGGELHFEAAIAALEVQRCPAGRAARQRGGREDLGDGGHGGRLGAGQQGIHVDRVGVGSLRHGRRFGGKDQRATIDVRGTLVLEEGVKGRLRGWVAGPFGGIRLRDEEDPAAQHIGEQPQAQNERGEQLAPTQTWVRTPGRPHVRPVRKSAILRRNVISNHTTPAFKHTEVP